MIPYSIHVAIILAGCLAFYKVLLQKETFFQLNRMVLLSCLLLSFALPLLKVPQEWSLQKTSIQVEVVDQPLDVQPEVYRNTETGSSNSKAINTASPGIDKQQILNWIFWLYWFGVAAFAINFLVQLLSLAIRAYRSPAIQDGKYRIVEVKGDSAPCSFANMIFINPEKYDWDTYNQILLHEKIHIEQRHTVDILIAELVLIVQWFNPFAWLYRKELENNLEFLTDEQLLKHAEIETKSYQLSLLKVSAPHFPLSLTTNYNQSLLKKRLLMMNAKKSNVHTTWKYLFMVPMLVLLVCGLNEPIAKAQVNTNKTVKAKAKPGLNTEGAWFATIKGDKVSMQFKNDEDDNTSMSSTNFPLSAFTNLPRDKSGSFTMTREAGSIVFTGKFDGDQGMGRYKFNPNSAFASYLKAEQVTDTDEEDLMTYFMVDLTKPYIEMLKSNGYKGLEKNELVPLAALKIDQEFIATLKKNGFKNLDVQELIPLKAMNITESFIQDIKKSGYEDVTPHQLITFKAQGIDGKYIRDMKEASKKSNENVPEKEITANDIVTSKALNVNSEYVESIKEVVKEEISNSTMFSMKALGITPEYIRELNQLGLGELRANDIIGLKAQHINKDFVNGFKAIGYTNLSASNVVPLKALGVTPEYIKSFNAAGYSDIDLQKIITLKANHITPDLINEYKSLGFGTLSLNDVVAAKATGTSPTFVREMQKKGHDLKSLNKYIQLRTVIN